MIEAQSLEAMKNSVAAMGGSSHHIYITLFNSQDDTYK